MTVEQALQTFLDGVLNMTPGSWVIQWPQWNDTDKQKRFAVIRPAGGLPVELVRRPQLTVSLIGAVDEDASVARQAAEAVIEAMKTGSGSLVFIQPGEPQWLPTADKRPVFDLAVSAITT